MTAQELIIGHYEKTLSTEQESQLQTMLAESPETCALYQQHGKIQSLMADEARQIEPSRKLEKAVVAAALGAVTEIAGHAAGFSIAGKIAAAISVVVVAGVSTFLVVNSGNETKPAPTSEKTPAVNVIPAPTPAVNPVDSTRVEAPAPQPAQPSQASTTGTRGRENGTARPSATRGGSNGEINLSPKHPDATKTDSARIKSSNRNPRRSR